jgi:Fe2+ or Zn2+ uptake regulation protein
MIRTLIAAGLLATLMAAPKAFAQGDAHHHAWCRPVGRGLECAYDTLTQCQESVFGRLGRPRWCVRNTSRAAANASAQGSYHHHRWCMRVGSSVECAYDTLSQCRVSAISNRGRCVRNTPMMNHR